MPDTPRKPRGQSKREAFLKLARDRFEQAEEANKGQRQRELDDLRFYAGDQWPDDIKALRAGLDPQDGMPAVPARPCITINKTRKPILEVLNSERSADIGIEIVPADDFGEVAEPISENEINTREGLTRRIQRDSKASDARTWAFSRSTIAGTGVYAVMTRYAKGKTRDKEVYVHRIFNQSCVSMDPAREQPDGSDAEWVMLWADVPWSRYVAEYGKRNGKPNRVVTCDANDWRTFGDEEPDWFEGDYDEMRSVRVGSYFYVEYEPREVVTYSNGTEETTQWLDEMPDAPDGWEEVDRHTDMQRSIKHCTLDGCDDDVLDETDWEGPDMPFVEVVGEELHPYDKELKRREGMVRPMREPAQGFNVMVSSWVERIGLAPLPPLMMVEGQAEGYEEWYKAANTRTLPYLYYKSTDINDRPVSSPPFAPDRGLGQVIGPLAQSVGLFDQAIQSTSLSNASIGQTDSSVKSARHASLLREQGQQGTSNYLDNLKRSMRYEAQIINNLLYPIYGKRPGRLARLIDGQGDAQDIIIGKPMVLQNGRPAPAQDGAQGAKTYTLTENAQFNVAIKLSKDYDTRRQQEQATVGEIVAAAPALMNVIGDLFFKYMDGPGHTEMAERMKAMLDPRVIAVIDAKKQGQEAPSPKEQQLQQQLQQVTQQAQQMQQMLQTEQAKEQAETQRSQAETAAKVAIEQAKIQSDQALADIKARTDIELAKMDNATKLQIEEFKLRGTAMQLELDARQAALGAAQTGADREATAAQSDADRRASAEEAERGRMESEAGRQHESVEAAAAREAAAQEAERGRQAAAEQAAMQAEQGGRQ